MNAARGTEPGETGTRVESLVAELVRRRGAGEEPDPFQLILDHPDLAVELEQRLEADGLLYPEPEPPPPTGTPLPAAIGRYEVRGVLGRGSSSVVYRAFDPKFGREVALKVLRADALGGPDPLARFERDARSAAQLRHAHIVPLHETGQDGDCHYIDMEKVDGGTLESFMQEQAGRPLDGRAAATLVYQVALALEHAHRAGVVHRDVKPSNILLDARGEPQLTDFGLARLAGGEPALTLSGQVLGTPAYMSPEQARGAAHQVDGRSDVYSLGVVFYRLLTGRLPLEADSLPGLLTRVAHEESPPPRSVNPAVPRDLDLICRRALEKEPGDRFAGAGAFAEELWRWLNGEPLRIRPPTWVEKMRRWARRNRLTAWVAVVAVVLLLAVSVVLGAVAVTARVRALAEARSRAEVETQALVGLARQRLRIPSQGRRTEAQKLLRHARDRRRLLPASPVAERFELEVRSTYAATLGVPELRVDEKVDLPGNPFTIWHVSLHPGGQHLAVGTPTRPRLWERGRPFPVADLPVEGPRPRVAYNPDGRYLAYAPEEGGLELWDGDLAHVLGKWPGTSPVLAVDFSPDGKTLWACRADGHVRALALPGLAEGAAWSVTGGPVRLTAAAFGGGGARLAAGDDRGWVWLARSGGVAVGPGLPRARHPIDALAWSPDGRLVAAGTRDGNVQLWDVAGGDPSHRLVGFSSGIGGILFHPCGRWLLAGQRSCLKVWDVHTGEQVLSTLDLGVPAGLARDGCTLAVGGLSRLAFATLELPWALRTLPGHGATVAQVIWARDNRHLVSLDWGFGLRIWDVDRGTSRDAFPAPPGDLYAENAGLAISDDGGMVAYASGAERRSEVLVRDVQRQVFAGRWSLPPGFERMVCPGGERFLLVREERADRPAEKGGDVWPVRSVAYEVTAGQGPRRLRVVRAAEPGDWRRFIDSRLTPDGRYQCWVGPRKPSEERRIEVRAVATGRLLFRLPCPEPSPWETFARISPDGGCLWVNSRQGCWRHDLVHGGPPAENALWPAAVALDRRWLASGDATSSFGIQGLALREWDSEQPWLLFHNADLSGFEATAFSPDGRYLAWGSDSGTITIADLDALAAALRDFEGPDADAGP